jgi:pilus assembly protein TadC
MVKPGASVIATAKDEAGKEYPALVVQRFGRGRTAAFTLGDVWRWGFRDAAAHRDMDKAWRQLVRWLVTDVPNRVDLADLRSVTSALVQADELGVSIGAILRIQSDQMRQRRFDRAERLANEAPVKLLGPLMLFIFPCVFIVLLGPILKEAMGHMF